MSSLSLNKQNKELLIKEIKIPIGISVAGNNVLHKLSAINKKIAPVIAQKGNKILCSVPINIRTICGTINPTKPIIPAEKTTIATNKALPNKKHIYILPNLFLK